MRLARPVLLMTSAALAVAGCDGCGDASGPSVSPARYVAQDAKVVLEIADVGALVSAREQVKAQFSGFVSEPQMAGLQKELTLSFGFDPSTVEGLAQAGLPKSGRIMVQIDPSGSGGLWVIPVADAKKFGPVLDKMVASRLGFDEQRKAKIGAHDVVVYETAFGDQKVVGAARAFVPGFALVGVSKEAEKIVGAALALKPEQTIEKNAEYAALTKALGDGWDLRMISPAGGEALSSALKAASQAVPEAQLLAGAELGAVQSLGWVADLSASGVSVKGRVRLDEGGRALAKQIFTAPKEPSAGVKAVGLPQAVVSVQAAMAPKPTLDLLAPKGSPARLRVDRLGTRLKQDLGKDLDTDLLPLLDGHAALSIGLGDMSKVDFRKVVGNPQSLVWTAFALGVKDPKAAVQIEQNLDEGLKKRGLDIVTRDVDGHTIRSVVLPPRAGVDKPPAPLVETSGFAGAWMFCNEPALTDAIVKNTSAGSALGGQAGLYAEVDFASLNRQIASFRFGDLPVLYRSVLAKLLDVLKMLDDLTVRVRPSAEGLEMQGELTLVPIPAKATP